MLCARSEVFSSGGCEEGDDTTSSFCFSPRNSSCNASSTGFAFPVNFGGSIQRYLWRSGKANRQRSRSFSSGDTCSASPDFEDKYSGKERTGKMYVYRFQLEQDIQSLQKELEEEIQLHLTLANAIGHCNLSLSGASTHLPDKAQDLLGSIMLLETAVAKLERELVALQHQLHQERNQRRITEYNLRHSSFRGSLASETSPSLMPINSSSGQKEDTKIGYVSCWLDAFQPPTKDLLLEHSWHHPNHLSEEMVSCMRDIFISLSVSSRGSSFQSTASPASPLGPLSNDSEPSSSYSSMETSPARRSSDLESCRATSSKVGIFDPYTVPGKLNWAGNMATYSMAVEVSALAVGKKELIYAAGALKRFRLLVEHLAKVNPSSMNHDEKLAFWINLYNALIMHAYLAYGVPKSDVKLFSLMQKASYTVGGQTFSAAEIEFIILKMKPPPHRPQIALCVAVHEFKELEERELYSINQPEPLLPFALSCGMHSSPAVRIFKPETVGNMLRQSLKDYVEASVGISDKGKILVPKLLHSFVKGIVQDSSLPEWICQFLPAEQANMVRECSSKYKWRLLGARSFIIVPFCSTFRYLFLFEDGCSF